MQSFYAVQDFLPQKMSFTVVCQKNSQKRCFSTEYKVFIEKVLHVHQIKEL